MAEIPSGTVTLLFTDIEGSTKLLQRAGDSYADLLHQHRRLLRGAFDAFGGHEVDSEGDAFFVAFSSASEAVFAAADAQRALAQHEWPEDADMRVRIGVHTGEPRLIDGRYVGLDVHRAARVMAAGHGGQVVLSQATRDLLDERFNLRDLGEHRLKDLSEPQRLYQLQVEGLPHEFPALKTLENRPTNLPVQATQLIGRESALNEIEALLRGRNLRLVTLTGPGGTGKTRLALQVGADLIDDFPNGVFFVSLAPISDPELLLPTIAQTLGLREQSGESLLETLKEYLHEKEMLLLLDNLEHILEATPNVAFLLGSAPRLKVLATSRTPLRLSGEHIYDVLPLAVPDVRRLPELSALTQFEAVALFTERAQAAKSGFEITNENAPAIAEICVRLDGLPLALELAAARVRALPPQALLSRLDDRLKLLTRGALDLDDRQRTLRATIGWSYDLLLEGERRLFAHLGVFVNGCRLDAAEKICDTEQVDGQSVLDGLSSLIEKSLLRQKEDPDGEPRFWMLATIKEYADERLGEIADAQAVRRRHSDYYFRLSEEGAAQLDGEQQSVWMTLLEQEHGNLRSALGFWRCEPDSQLGMANSLEKFWRVRGHWEEARRWLDEALATSSETSPQRLHGLENGHYFAYLQGNTEYARTLLEELLPLAQRLTNRSMTARALNGLANLAALEGENERATMLYEESLGFCEGEHESIYPLSGLGFLAFLRDDFKRARAFFERSLAIGRAFRDDFEVAQDLSGLATIAAFERDEQGALTLLRESVALARKVDSPPVIINRCLPALAAVRSVQGDKTEAVKLIGASDALREELGSPGSSVSQDLKRRILEAAQSELEEERTRAAFHQGRALTFEEALAHLLEVEHG